MQMLKALILGGAALQRCDKAFILMRGFSPCGCGFDLSSKL